MKMQSTEVVLIWALSIYSALAMVIEPLAIKFEINTMFYLCEVMNDFSDVKNLLFVKKILIVYRLARIVSPLPHPYK